MKDERGSLSPSLFLHRDGGIPRRCVLPPRMVRSSGRPWDGVFGSQEGAGGCAPYTSSLKHKVKVLDFVKRGGPILTVDRTTLELAISL